MWIKAVKRFGFLSSNPPIPKLHALVSGRLAPISIINTCAGYGDAWQLTCVSIVCMRWQAVLYMEAARPMDRTGLLLHRLLLQCHKGIVPSVHTQEGRLKCFWQHCRRNPPDSAVCCVNLQTIFRLVATKCLVHHYHFCKYQRYSDQW